MPPKRSPPPESAASSPLSAQSRSASPEAPPAKKAKGKVVKGPKVPKEKKVKEPKGPVQPIHAHLPNNTVFPLDLKFEKPTMAKVEEGVEEKKVVRLSSWNICGIKACEKKGLMRYLAAEGADIVVLTETKSVDPGIKEINEMYPFRYWGTDPKKGYAGTAILSKIEPISVVFGIPPTPSSVAASGEKEADSEIKAEVEEREEAEAEKEWTQTESAGRIVTLEFPNTYVVGTYVPNAGQGLKTLSSKASWNKVFERYLRELDAVKPVVWTGDINCVQEEKDIRNWKTNYQKSAGCTQVEISGLFSQLNPDPASGHSKLLDIWRVKHPEDVGYYTYFSYKFQCRVKGIGWRLDTFLVSERIAEKVQQCEIRMEVYGGSDHVPVMLDIEGPL